MKADERLLQWIADYCHGVISAEDFAALEQLLGNSPEARATFRSHLHLDAELRQRAERDPALEAAWAPRIDRPNVGLVRPQWNRAAGWLALAAAVALLAILGWRLIPSTFRSGEVVAKVTESSGAVLEAGGRSMTVETGSALRAGSYELRCGLLEITYAHGVVVIVESPAQFDLQTPSLLSLRTGKLSARVAQTAIGFTVETPSATVVDLGTEFGVNAEAMSSEVHVFKGEVLVKSAGAMEPQHVSEHRASRIDSSTGTPAGIKFAPQDFVRSLQETAGLFAQQMRQLHPVAYYRMRMPTDGETLKDVVSGGHDGRVFRGRSRNPWAPGKIGTAMRLGGAEVGAYALVADLPKAMNQSLAVCAWVLAESRPRSANIVGNWSINGGSDEGGQFQFGLAQDEETLEVRVHDALGREVAARESQPLPIGDWQFVAFSLDGTTLRLYRNGIEVATAPCAGLATFGSAALGIGVKLKPSKLEPELNIPGFWSGRIDELAIFHRALTESEIGELYKIASPQP